MQAIAFDQSFEQRLAKIDLGKVMQHVQRDTGMDEATLARAEDLYRKFLTLKAKNPQGFLVPPVIVDHVWHAHITFTRQYMADCDLLFGGYLHHTPTDEAEHETSQFLFHQVTVASYRQEFGIDLYSAAVFNGSVAVCDCY